MFLERTRDPDRLRSIGLGAPLDAITARVPSVGSAVLGPWDPRAAAAAVGGACVHCDAPLHDARCVPVVARRGNFAPTIEVYGAFCSFACGLGHLYERQASERVMGWTRLLYLEHFGARQADLRVAPPRVTLLARRRGGGGGPVRAVREVLDWIPRVFCLVEHADAADARGDTAAAGDDDEAAPPLRRQRPRERAASGEAFVSTGTPPLLVTTLLSEEPAAPAPTPRRSTRRRAAAATTTAADG